MRTFLAIMALLLLPSLRAASPADATFEAAAHAFIEDYLRLNPEDATELGDHRYDDRLRDYSAEGVKAREAAWQKHLAALRKIDAKQLSGTNRIDARIMEVQLESMLFGLREIREGEWDPLTYNPSLATSIYQLTSREFAPAEQRLRSAIARLNAMPGVLAQLRTNLRNPPRVHTETAIKQTTGGIEMVRSGLDPLIAKAPSLGELAAPAQAKAIAALEAYQRWLEKDVLPNAQGEFRLGAERFRQKLRFELDSDLSPEQIRERAERELEKTTEALSTTATPLFKRYFPDRPVPERAALIKAVFDRLAERQANDDTVVARCKELVASATDFVAAHQIVTLPNAPIQVIVLPEFQRGVAVAYCQPPGALEPNGETFFAVSPTPKDWTDARRTSFFREYNDYMLHDLTIHEAMPGHYLQLAHSNQFHAPTLIRAIFSSGSFVEGWAVYTERVMADEGFGGPEVKMQQLKMRLRAIINALIDQRVHMHGMTEKEAMALMIDRGFQEEGEAAGKWRRVVQSSTQLSTYFVGAIEHDDLRAAAEKRDGKNFNLKRYHDTVLSFGSPAVKYVRQEMGL